MLKRARRAVAVRRRALRITDAATVEIVEMVLAGSINKQIVGFINAAGGQAVGLCGKDGNMVRRRAKGDADGGRSGFRISRRSSTSASSASPTRSTPPCSTPVLGRELIPVLAPVAASADGGSYNVNADTFAGAIAGALKAKRLLLLTDVPGVLDKSKQLIKEISAADARAADRRRHHLRPA